MILFFRRSLKKIQRQARMISQQNKFKLTGGVIEIDSMEMVRNQDSRLKFKIDQETNQVEILTIGESENNVVQNIPEKISLVEMISSGDVQNFLYDPLTASLTPDINLKGFTLFPGSFNPLHIGHIELAKKAANDFTDGKVVLELSIGNADKGFISEEQLLKRIKNFKKPEYPLVINQASLFKTKLEYLSKGYFLMGADTFIRVFDLKYYQSEEELEDFCQLMIDRGMSIAVGGRVDKEGNFKSAEDYLGIVPDMYKDFVSPVLDYRMDLSSTDIRSGKIGTGIND